MSDRTDDARDHAGDRSLHLGRGACGCQPAGRKSRGRLRAGSACRPRWRAAGRPIRPTWESVRRTAEPAGPTEPAGEPVRTTRKPVRRPARASVRRRGQQRHAGRTEWVSGGRSVPTMSQPAIGFDRVRWHRAAAGPQSAACALGFGSIVALGFADGGYYDGPGTRQRSRSERSRASGSCSVAGRCRAARAGLTLSTRRVSQR